MTDADLCRSRGWGPGTRLVGDEGHGPTVIEVTAVGIERILARQVSHCGKPAVYDEAMWTLFHREWKEVEE